MKESQQTSRLRGELLTGLGLGAEFTRLPWAVEQFVAGFGIDPHPGTLNLRLSGELDQQRWLERQRQPATRLQSPDPTSCDALGFAVMLNERIPAAVIQPQLASYAANQLEIIAAVALREALDLQDGDTVEVEFIEPENLEAIIFDVDGTLINSVDAYHIAAGLAAAEHGLTVTRELVHQALDSQQPFWQLLLPAAQQADQAFVDGLRAATLQHWPAVLETYVSVFPGLELTLDSLVNAGVRLAIYTGSQGESFAPLERSGLLERFEFILTGADVRQAKPDPEGLLRCLEKMGVAASQSAYVGDTSVDMQAAAAAGVVPVAVLSGAGAAGSLSRAGARHLLRDHADLSRVIKTIS